MISFIVPAYNEALLLGSTLDALHRAAESVGDSYEIIVADDDSSDETATVARAHGATVTRVRNRRIAATRNAGAKLAKGAWLFFVDADTLVPGDTLREALGVLREGAAGGGAAFRFDSPIPRYGRALQWLVYPAYRMGKIASGSFMFCTRDAFDQVGGFAESLYGGEEAVMSRALRRIGRFVILKNVVITSGRKLRLYSFWKIMGTIARAGLSGGKITNEKLAQVWYDGKRETNEEICK